MIVVWTPNNDQPLWVQTGTPTTWTIPQLPIGDGWKPMKRPILVVNIQLYQLFWCSESTSFLTHSEKNRYTNESQRFYRNTNEKMVAWLPKWYPNGDFVGSVHGDPWASRAERCRLMGLSAPSVEEHYGEHPGIGPLDFWTKKGPMSCNSWCPSSLAKLVYKSH